MQLFIQFPDFSNTAAIDKYIEKRLRSIYRRLDGVYENPVITLRGSVLNRRPDGAPKNFEAELLVKVPKSRSRFVVKKKNKDFRSALSDAADAMETVLRRDSEKSERTRKTLGKSLYPVRKVKRSASLPKKKSKQS